jgi:hypothetical protein
MFLNLFQLEAPHIRCRSRDLCHRKLRSPVFDTTHRQSISNRITVFYDVCQQLESNSVQVPREKRCE